MVALSNGYRLKPTRASRMSELADRIITAIAAVGGSAGTFRAGDVGLSRRIRFPIRSPSINSVQHTGVPLALYLY